MKHSFFSQLTHQSVQLCGEHGITINDPKYGPQTFFPDESMALLEFRLSHAFPVTTCDGTFIHPQVVANSYQSLRNKVFNFGHLMRSYDPKSNPRDRILGSIIAVEFPEMPPAGWRLDVPRHEAPGIRAIASLFKAAEGVEDILRSHQWGKDWAVSMENIHNMIECGFLVRGGKGITEPELTPPSLAMLGYHYIPIEKASRELKACLNNADDDRADNYEGVRVKRSYRGQETLFAVGGLNGTIHYCGTGLCQVGKEDEAVVSRMMASRFQNFEGVAQPDFMSPFRSLLAVAEKISGK